VAAVEGLALALQVLTSLALGSLMGAAIYKLLTERFNAWQLQLGRAGNYFRRGRK
jgi:hypothetical protein